MTPVKTHACPRCDDPGLGWSAFLAYTSPSNPSYSPPLSHARTHARPRWVGSAAAWVDLGTDRNASSVFMRNIPS